MANLLPMVSSINQWLILLVAFYFSGLMLLMLLFDHFYRTETAAAAGATWQKAQQRHKPKDKCIRQHFMNEYVFQNAEVSVENTGDKFEVLVHTRKCLNTTSTICICFFNAHTHTQMNTFVSLSVWRMLSNALQKLKFHMGRLQLTATTRLTM